MRNTATVGFIMSHACPLKCDFCCHDRQVLGPGRLRRTEIESHLIAFGAEASVTRFGFSGGEPFLYFDDIVAALSSARAAGVTQPFSVVTSAHWAKAPGAAEKLRTLRDLGLDLINLSYDTEHAKWVTPEDIRRVGHYSRELGIRVEVSAAFWDKDESILDLLPDVEDWADQVYSYWVVRSGRAGRSGRRANHDMPTEAKFSCGKPTHYTVVIHPDGKVFPCCAGDFNQAAKISCGDVRVDTPAQILENAYSNFHVRMAKELGWGALYDLIEREYPELVPQLTAFEDVDSPCEICRDLNVKMKEVLAPIYDRIEAVYAQAMAEADIAGLPAQDDSGPMRLGSRCGSAAELFQALADDRKGRRRYIAGLDQIAAC